ncbi:MAG: hypothetical protein ACREDL_08225, partial [Bradyrhizobium sp.]
VVRWRGEYGSLPQTGELLVKRKILCLAALAVVAMMLGGCDKCGNFEKLNVPGVPKTCNAAPTPS